MKSKEELNKLKEEDETVNRKLHKLTDEELGQVVGGVGPGIDSKPGVASGGELGTSTTTTYIE